MPSRITQKSSLGRSGLSSLILLMKSMNLSKMSSRLRDLKLSVKSVSDSRCLKSIRRPIRVIRIVLRLTWSFKFNVALKKSSRVARWNSSGNTWMITSSRYSCAITSRHWMICSSKVGNMCSL
ncbi:hypothetical protein OGAPHI_000819 [Ogataea philodendri]|uniref:Uncharacterized protein n=1 Tax=Ogataea philodendri TaxID=1378263 RepID=A0A9P8PF37_9ASCO|nr:uncharacterized protein OGAPHI_000819 [Ogataea philodendri]KAH3671108.1 hypothetical protein OGAPHI_000819 [Ogataea philodendri]